VRRHERRNAKILRWNAFAGCNAISSAAMRSIDVTDQFSQLITTLSLGSDRPSSFQERYASMISPRLSGPRRSAVTIGDQIKHALFIVTAPVLWLYSCGRVVRFPFRRSNPQSALTFR